jgi:hypothetical protein
MYEIIKKNDFDSFYKEFQEKKFMDFLFELRNYLNYRSYYNITQDGTIKKKGLNLSLIKLIFGERTKEEVKEFFEEGIYFKENQKLKKIDRMSNAKVDDLKKNLFKIYFNRDLAVALRYTKEYYYRDPEGLKKQLALYVLHDRSDSKKALMLLTMFRLFKVVKKDEDLDTVLHICLTYIVKYPSNFEENYATIEDNREDDIYTLAYKELMNYYGVEERWEKNLGSYRRIEEKNKTEDFIYERLSEGNELY